MRRRSSGSGSRTPWVAGVLLLTEATLTDVPEPKAAGEPAPAVD